MRILLAAVFGLVLTLSGRFPIARADEEPSEPIVWRTGRGLEKELARPINVVLNRTTPRAVVHKLRELHHVALLLDRRMDPDRPIDVQFTQVSLHEALQILALQLDGELVQIGGTLFIGPAASTDRLHTLIALRTQEVRTLEGNQAAARQFELLRGTTLAWGELAEPAQLLDEAARAFHVKRSGDDSMPHDLWGRGVMADVNAPEAFGLLLGQFDLTFEWQEEGDAVRIVPAPESVAVMQSHTPRSLTIAESIEQIRSQWPHLEPHSEGRTITLNATAGEHAAIAELLAPQQTKPAPEATLGPLSRRRFTLTATRTEAIAILRTLETQDVAIVYDADALRAARIDLTTRVSLQLKGATAEELFTQLCDPLGLKYAIDGKTVTLTPKE